MNLRDAADTIYISGCRNFTICMTDALTQINLGSVHRQTVCCKKCNGTRITV